MPEAERAVSNHTMYVFAKDKYLKALLGSGRITQEQYGRMEHFLYERFGIDAVEDFDLPIAPPIPTVQNASTAPATGLVQIEKTREPVAEGNAPSPTLATIPQRVSPLDLGMEYVSLTELAREHNPDNPGYVIQLWLQNQNTIEFLRLWEGANNPQFNPEVCNNIQVKLRDNTFTLTAKYWIEQTSSIGLKSKSGRGGGTLAHPVIACEFLTGLSPGFKLSLIEMNQMVLASVGDADA